MAQEKKRQGYNSADRKKYSALVAELLDYKTDSIILTLSNSSMESIAQIVYERIPLELNSIQTVHRKYLQRVIPAALVHAVKVKTKASHQHVMVATTGLKIDKATLQKPSCLKFLFKSLDALDCRLVTAEEVANQIPFTLNVTKKKGRQFSASMSTSYPNKDTQKPSFQHSTDAIKLQYPDGKPPAAGIPIQCIACCPYSLMPNFDRLVTIDAVTRRRTKKSMPKDQQVIYSFKGLEVVFTIVVCKIELVNLPFGDYVQQYIKQQEGTSSQQFTPSHVTPRMGAKLDYSQWARNRQKLKDGSSEPWVGPSQPPTPKGKQPMKQPFCLQDQDDQPDENLDSTGGTTDDSTEIHNQDLTDDCADCESQ